MTVAPEIPNALELIEKGAEAGIVMSAGHTEARQQEMKAGLERGIAKITHLFNAMTYAAKKGVFREPGLAEYALIEDHVVCELIADNFHVAPTLMKLAYRTKGPGRLTLISDALAGTGLPVGTKFMLGKLQCKVAEGVCMLADGSALAGSATRSIDQVRIITEMVGVPLPEAVRMASETPARLLRLDDRYGSIGEGKAADLVQFDDGYIVRRVWVGGELVHSFAT
jgi:N-acetylglucosamine-6-phosphate deacetylase